ncbi:S8 family serine peptidase [Streptococcus sp. DD13]|uniref:S8 family serine peptidase n=1 Tax=Streptococcus sp. DD13 TaxID=1777881 RepID=UPI000795FB69|nr:S8 family serine peptidase [Streptococcus sp. DD13]KXT77678.1 Serine endopeptidase ScpC [Streptococcus sp. DD13]
MKKERFSLRKYKFGLASVLLGSVFVVGNAVAQADELVSSADQVQVVSATGQAEGATTAVTDEEITPSEGGRQETAVTPKTDAATNPQEGTEETSPESSQTEEVGQTPQAAIASSETSEKASDGTEKQSAEISEKSNPTEAVTPKSTSSNEIIHASQSWDLGYKGEGTVIAVIDSGLDLEHDVLRITDVAKAKYKSAAEMDAVKEKAGIDYGKWYSDKVVFAYDYMDADDQIKEQKQSSHGMHVTGIAAGNPSKPISSGEYVFGVAPEAQVMFMRVFSDRSGSTSESIYAKAIRDAVDLGADSINLSLGSVTGSQVNAGSMIQEAVEYARQNGVSVLISAGNSNVYGDGYSQPLAENPDYGTVGNPSTVEGTISVASVNNSVLTTEVMEVIGLEDDVQQNRGKWNFTYAVTNGRFEKGKAYDYVYAGLGQEGDFASLDVKGKIALVQRGMITFGDKVLNALRHGAVGVVVYNNVDGANVTMGLSGEAAQAPAIFISKAYGEALKDHPYKLSFNQNVADVTATDAQKMSAFSSWGVTIDGALKPDVTAPGGYIYSSLNDETYGSMNGTSMASPHVAGVAALVTEYVKKTYPDKAPEEISALVKGLIMSTAKLHVNAETGAYTSPRQQGAGVVDVAAAVSTGLYITGLDGYPSVSMGNVGDSFSFDVVVHNVSQQDRTLKMIVNTDTDQVENGRFTLTPRKLTETVWPEVTIKAGSSETVTVKIDASRFAEELTTLMPNGYFLEGFVRFVDPADDGDVVSLPFIGFRGAFQDLPVAEQPIYNLIRDGKNGFYYTIPADHEIPANAPASYVATGVSKRLVSTGTNSYQGLTLLGSVEQEDGRYLLALDENGQVRFAISPNGDDNQDQIFYRSVFYRTAYNVKAEVYAADDTEWTHPLWESATVDARPNYYDGNPQNPKSYALSNTIWGGEDSQGRLLADGTYVYVIRMTPAVPGAEDQVTRFTIQIDTQKPVITTGYITEKDGQRYFYARAAKDPGNGGVLSQKVFYIKAQEDGSYTYQGRDALGQVHTYEERIYVTANADGGFTLPEGIAIADLYYIVEDYAGNSDLISLSELVGDQHSGRVQVILADADTHEQVDTAFVYRVKNAQGQYVTVDKSKAINFLPFGQYEIELFTYNTGDLRLKSAKVLPLNLTEENSFQTIEFLVKEVTLAPLSVVFDQAVPKSTTLILEDEDGNFVSLPSEKYGKNSFGKSVATGVYRLVASLPTGYELYGDIDQISVLAGKTNRVYLKVVSKVSLLSSITQADKVLQTAAFYNASESRKAGYQLALTNAQTGVTSKLTQEEVDQLLAQLEAAQGQLDGKETDIVALKRRVQDYAALTQTGRYANAKASKQQAFDRAFQALALLLTADQVTQNQVDQVLTQLDQASKALDGKATNFSSLEKLIQKEAKEQEKNEKFLYASAKVKEAYLIAFQKAQAVLKNPGASQEDVKEAVNELKAAKKKLDGKKPKKSKEKRV